MIAQQVNMVSLIRKFHNHVDIAQTSSMTLNQELKVQHQVQLLVFLIKYLL